MMGQIVNSVCGNALLNHAVDKLPAALFIAAQPHYACMPNDLAIGPVV